MKTFKAKLSPTLFVFSVVFSAGILFLAGYDLVANSKDPHLIIIAILLLCFFLFLHSVKEYKILNNKLIISRRGGWSTVVDLSGLRAAHSDSKLIWKSLSLFSTMGVFGINGFIWNSDTGIYKIFLTAPSKLVLLELQDGSKIAVSPEDQQSFLSLLNNGFTNKTK